MSTCLPIDPALKVFRLAIAAVCLGAMTIIAVAKPAVVYQGTLGSGRHVVLELEDADRTSPVRKGRYFYRRYGVDIPLVGTLDSLTEAMPLVDVATADHNYGDVLFADPKTGKPRAVWQGTLEGPRYIGQWLDTASGKLLPFVLSRVASYDSYPAKGR